MNLEAPTIDFTPIALASVVSSVVCDQESTKRASVETCTGPDAPQNMQYDCEDEVNMM